MIPESALAPGASVGPYRIESLIGAGGLGEVYRAQDTRLNRTVAIKVLRPVFAKDPALRHRFEREARAIAAIHHPHICVLHDVGHEGDVDFLVMEYIEGETVEHRLKKGALPLDRVLQHAIEIAQALGAAHQAGVVHRDLKPGNVMLTRNGAKVLDFGLARIGVDTRTLHATGLPTVSPTLTERGTILGTFQYMAPEQIEGRQADARTDVFAFGALVHEMATGRRAFDGGSSTSIIAAILRDNPPAISALQPVSPPALDLVVRACLEKDPDHRYQSAHDLAAQLRWIRDDISPPAIGTSAIGRRRARAWIVGAAIVAAMTAAGGYVAGARRDASADTSLRRLTFRRGNVGRALFAPDGQTIVYAASWDGEPGQIMSMRADTGESLPLPLPAGTQLLSISRSGELAVLLAPQGSVGMLARVPLGGAGVREMLDQVMDAAWSPDGGSLAVIRDDRSGRKWLEFPIGKTLYETRSADMFSVRLSPDGDRVAFVEQDADGGGWISVVDRSGSVKRWSRKWPGVNGGLVWTRSGAEVWFSASDVGLNTAVHAVNSRGEERVVERSLGSNRVVDLAADGRALLVHELIRAGMVGLAPGDTHERDLSWLDFTRPKHLSDDGRVVLFVESGAGGGEKPVTYMRRTDGSPAVRLGEGSGLALSPDGRWVLALVEANKRLALMPTGPGDLRILDTGALGGFNQVGEWMPDGSRVAFDAREPGRPPRVFVQSVTGGKPQAITPEGVRTGRLVISPDSTHVITSVGDGPFMRYPVDGGKPLAIPGLTDGDAPLQFSRDGQSIWVLRRGDTPPAIWQIDLAGGQRRLWRELAVAAGSDPDWLRVELSADGKSYVQGYMRQFSDLYLAGGLK